MAILIIKDKEKLCIRKGSSKQECIRGNECVERSESAFGKFRIETTIDQERAFQWRAATCKGRASQWKAATNKEGTNLRKSTTNKSSEFLQSRDQSPCTQTLRPSQTSTQGPSHRWIASNHKIRSSLSRRHRRQSKQHSKPVQLAPTMGRKSFQQQ